MTEQLSKRLRLAQAIFVISEIGSVVAIFLWGLAFGLRDGKLGGMEDETLVFVATWVLASVIFARSARNRPRAWRTGLGWTGIVLGLGTTAILWVIYEDQDQTGLLLLYTISLGPSLTGFALGRLIGGFAMSLVLDRPIAELADSPLELVFIARRKEASLVITPDHIMYTYIIRKGWSFFPGHVRQLEPLTKVTSVKRFTLNRKALPVMRDEDGEILRTRTNPEPALKIMVGKVWVFATEEGDRIGELIRLRLAILRKKAGAAMSD